MDHKAMTTSQSCPSQLACRPGKPLPTSRQHYLISSSDQNVVLCWRWMWILHHHWVNNTEPVESERKEFALWQRERKRPCPKSSSAYSQVCDPEKVPLSGEAYLPWGILETMQGTYWPIVGMLIYCNCFWPHCVKQASLGSIVHENKLPGSMSLLS